MIYAALFCLEYKAKPKDIEIELRIYQNDDIIVHVPSEDDILAIMLKITHMNTLLEENDMEI